MAGEAKKTGMGGKIAVVAVLTIFAGAIVYLGVKMSKMAKDAKDKQDAADKEIEEAAATVS